MAIVAPRRHLVRFLLVVMTLSIVQCYTLRSNLVQSVRCSLGRGLSTAPAKSSASLEVDVQPVLSSSVKIKRKPSKSALSSLCIDGSSTEVDVAKATSTKGKAKPQSSVQQGRSLHSSDDCIAFEIFGEPIALQRHRTLKTGVVFNPSSKQQKQFLESARPYLPSSPFEGPLEARLVFFFRRPLNHYGTGRNSNTLKMGMDVWHDKKKGMVPHLPSLGLRFH